MNSSVVWMSEKPEGGGAEPLQAGALPSMEAKASCVSLLSVRVPVLLGLSRTSQAKPLDKGQTSHLQLPMLLEQFSPCHGSD